MDQKNLDFAIDAGPVTQSPEIREDFSDSEIIDLVRRKVSEYKAYYGKNRIKERSEQNVAYWSRGDGSKTEGQNQPKRGRNNVIHRDLNSRVTNATSRMPDIVVMSPQMADKDNVREETRKVEEWLSIRFDSDVQRRLAKGGVTDNALKFVGIWKYRYDHAKKDAVIERPRPEDVILDSTARVPEDGFTCDNMEFVGEWITESTAVVLDRFPGKREELLAQLDKEMVEGKETARASKVRYLECWVTMHDREGKAKELLVNTYNDILLSKDPNPFFDYEEENETSMGMERHDMDDTLSQLSEISGIPVSPVSPDGGKPKRRNHFPFARKPYTLFTGDNLGDGPLDETTVVEITIPLQDIVNKRMDQITAINEWNIPKVVTMEDAMTSEKASNIDRDPSQVIVLSDKVQDVRQGLMTFSGEPASPALYKDVADTIAQIDAHFATTPIRQLSGESGLSKQISREDDLSVADEVSQNMVQRAVDEAANWLVQLGKIFFDEPHSAVGAGKDRSLRSASVSSSTIPDDIQIVVKANAVDKATLRNMSLNLVGSKAIDPMSLMEDLDYPNPKERAHRLIDFLNGPPSGYVKYLQDIGVNPGEPADRQSEQGAPQGAPGQAAQGQPAPGQPPVPGNVPDQASPIVPQALPAQ